MHFQKLQTCRPRICKRSRKGKFKAHVRTMRKRLRRSLLNVTAWCEKHRHDPVDKQQQALNRKLQGHYQYSGIIAQAFNNHCYNNSIRPPKSGHFNIHIYEWRASLDFSCLVCNIRHDHLFVGTDPSFYENTNQGNRRRKSPSSVSGTDGVWRLLAGFVQHYRPRIDLRIILSM
jgi:hypothetical protein